MTDELLSVALLMLLCMLSPGPDLVLVARNSLLGGRSAGLQTSLGILAGNAVHMGYCLLGVGWLVASSIVAFASLKLLGAAYLVYLGLQGLLSRSGDALLAPEAPGSAARARRWWVQGLVNNLLNPKGALFYLGIFTVVIRPERPWLWTGLCALLMLSIAASFWLVFVGTIGRPRVRELLQRRQRWIEVAFGVVLVALGLRLAIAVGEE